MTSSYIDPWRGHIRALERNIIIFRALQMTLTIHYAQELRRLVVDTAEANSRWSNLLKSEEGEQRTSQQTKSAFKSALSAWVRKALISEDEATDIRRLVSYRNDVAHRMHLLLSDLGSTKLAHDVAKSSATRLTAYDYNAPDEIGAWIQRLNDRLFGAGWVFVATRESFVFDTAEKALRDELRRLDTRITRLVARRKVENAALNSELDNIATAYRDESCPRHPSHTYNNGRLTPRGVEICYRLFDDGYSKLAVAHAFGLSMSSVRHRQALWLKAGGKKRSR